jgi:hypothetical protein
MYFYYPFKTAHYPFETPDDGKTREVSAQRMPFRYKKQGDREESPESSFSIFSPHDLPRERPRSLFGMPRGQTRPVNCIDQRPNAPIEGSVGSTNHGSMIQRIPTHPKKWQRGGDSARWHNRTRGEGGETVISQPGLAGWSGPRSKKN